MATENKDRPPEKPPRKIPDLRLIELDKPGEVTFWTKWFGVSDDELREAVRVAGNVAQNVALYFEHTRRSK